MDRMADEFRYSIEIWGDRMTKSGLIEEVAKRTPHISKKDTEVVVNTIFDAMIESLRGGDRIEIRGFGSSWGRKKCNNNE